MSDDDAQARAVRRAHLPYADALVAAIRAVGLQVDSILSSLRTGAVINFRWWRPSWQAGYEAGLRRAHEAVTEELGHLGIWTPSQKREADDA